MKNKNTYYFTLIILIGLSLFSCKKEASDSDENNTATCRIKKVTENNGNVTDYIYNADKQLTQITSGPSDPSTMNFTYNSDGSLHTFNGIDNNANATITFQYNNGTLVSATGTGQVTYTNTYQFSNDKLQNVITNYSGASVKTVFTYNGDNISKTERYGDTGGGNWTLIKTYTYEYDNKKNPLYGLGIENAFAIDGNYALFASKNNITRKIATNGNGQNDPNESAVFTYEYNSNNYPSKATRNMQIIATISYFPCE